MNRNLFFGLFFMLVLAFGVSADYTFTPATGSLTFDNLSVDKTFTINLSNTKAVDSNFSGFNFNLEGFTNGTFTFQNGYFTATMPTSLENGTYNELNFTLDLPANTYVATYYGKVNVTHNETTGVNSTAEFPLKVIVSDSKPDVSLTAVSETITADTSKTITFSVQNNGNTDLSGVSFSDDLTSTLAFTGSATIAHGQTENYQLKITAPSSAMTDQGTITVSATGGFSEGVVATVTVEDPTIEFTQTSVAVNNELPGEVFSEQVTVRNTGTKNLTGLIVSFSNSDFLMNSTPSSFDLTAGASRTLTIKGTVPDNVNMKSSPFTRTVTASNNDVTTSMDFIITPESQLEFDAITYEVDFARSEDDSEEGDISEGTQVDVKDGATVTIEGDIESLFSDDIDIKSVKVWLEASKLDNDGGSRKDDDKIGTMEFGDLEPFMFEFTVSYDEISGSSQSLDAKVYVEGKDDNGATHYTEIEFTFEWKKDDDEVTITEVTFDNSILTCNKETVMYVTLKNTGDNELDDGDDVELFVKNTKLGLNELIREIEMDEDDRKDSNELVFQFDIDASDIEPSSTPLRIAIEAYVDDDITDEEVVYLAVSECSSPTTTTFRQTTTTRAPTTTTQPFNTQLPDGQQSGPSYAQFPTEVSASRDNFANSTTYVVLLVLILVVFVATAALMVAYLLKK